MGWLDVKPWASENSIAKLVKQNPEISENHLKTNMSPENQWLEDVLITKMVPFEGTC